jgi:hypothetical protein
LLGGYVTKSFDAGGSYGSGTDWYLEAYVFVAPGASTDQATFAPGTGLGASSYISIHGNGAIDFFSGGASTQRTGSATFLNQWLRLIVEHSAADDGNLHMSVVGTGANESFTGAAGSVPAPGMISVNGPTAYWDDMLAVSGAVSVPEPTTAVLVALGIVGLGLNRRRRERSQ